MKPHHALKHLFIPHEGNDYKPHFFRELSVAIMLFVSIFLLGFSAGSSYLIHRTVLGASVAASVLVDLTNDARLAYNETPLIKNDKLVEAATLKGNDMVKFGYFAHESPTGVTPWYWFKQVGYTFLYAGENLAINFTESKDVENAWLNSPKHRENILNVKFSEIGIATVDGMYNNNPTTYVVQMFGTPAQQNPNTQIVESTKTASTSDLVQKENIQKSISTIANKLTGNVKGESAENSQATTSIKSNILQIFDNPYFSIVKNTDNVSEIASKQDNNHSVKYSTWYGRLVFSGPSYVDIIYKILIIIVALALFTMILIEVKKQHYKHILYGILLLLALAVFVYINKLFIY